jgi:hypothetical protein
MRSSPMRTPRGALLCAAAPELNPQPGRARPCVMRDRISDTTENPRFLKNASGARPCRNRSRAAPVPMRTAFLTCTIPRDPSQCAHGAIRDSRATDPT